jgi:hypothetical protein
LPRRGSTLVFVVVVAVLVLAGVVVLLQLVQGSRSRAIAYNDKIVATNLAEAATNRGLEILRLLYNPNALNWYEPDFLTLPASEFDRLVGDVILPQVNGAEGFQTASLRRPDDGRFRLLSLRRDEVTNIITLAGEGLYASPRVGREVRSVIEIDVELLFDSEQYGAAILSTSPDFGLTTGGGKPRAQAGNVVFDKNNGYMAVMGKVKANGAITNKLGQDLDDSNVADSIHTRHPPGLAAGLAASDDELPDASVSGGQDAIFDLDRMIAAADAGAGERFSGLQAFADALADRGTLSGIVVVDVDPADHVVRRGSAVQLLEPILGPLAGGTPAYIRTPDIAIDGTLIFNTAPQFTVEGITYDTPRSFRITIESPLLINPIDETEVMSYLAEVAAYSTAAANGDPNAHEPTPPLGANPFLADGYARARPWEVSLPAEYSPYAEGDDLPALAYRLGTIDVDGTANVGGVVFSPDFIEIQNMARTMQYFWGMVLSGGGVYVQDLGGQGQIGIVQGRGALDRLATDHHHLRTPKVVTWRQVE